MSYKKIYMSFNIKRHIHARVIFRWTRQSAWLDVVTTTLNRSE